MLSFFPSFYEILFSGLTYLILFLYGIDSLGREMQLTFGNKLRGILSKISENKWVGAGVSAIVTSLIQSSTATTVITVSLVDAGLISFSQSLGIIAGANIGTTITAQLVSLNLMQYGSIFLVLGFFISILFPDFKLLGKPLFFFGLVLFSLNLLTNALEPIKDNQQIINLIKSVNNPVYGVLIGILITIIIQSSSVTTGIVVILGSKNILSLEQAIPIILGANIGTTITSILASLKLDVFAKKTALAHLIFNVFGVLLFLPFISFLISLSQQFGGGTGREIANVHTIFNVSAAFLFLLFSKNIEELINKIIKTKYKEITFKTKYLKKEKNLLINIENAKMEIVHLMEVVKEELKLVYSFEDHSTEKQISKLEQMCDFLNEKISNFIYNMDVKNKELSSLIRISNELELISDLGSEFAYHSNRLKIKNRILTKLFKKIKIKTIENISLLMKIILHYDEKKYKKIISNKNKVMKYIKEIYDLKLESLPLSNLIHISETVIDKTKIIAKLIRSIR